MIKNILTITFRNILKHKLYSIINISGLTIGFSAFILISLFLKYEESWDKQNQKYDRIYRVQMRQTLAGNESVETQTPGALVDLLKEKYPEFERVVLMREAWGEFLSSSEVKSFFEHDGYYADSSYFDVFSYEFINGNKTKALSEPFSIVLSEKIADKLFPHHDAYGKTIFLDKKFNLKVTGVYKDLPENCHERPTYLVSMASFDKIKSWPNYRNDWGIDFRTYVLLKDGTDVQSVNKKIENFIQQNHKGDVVQKLYLHPLSKLYLQPEDKNDYMVAILIYAMVAIFILILSSINYINLTTSNSLIRGKEIAVRKVNGSGKNMLVGQFLGETIILSVLSMILALVVSKLFLPAFNSIIDRNLSLSCFDNWQFILLIIGISVLVGFFSGLYPALIMSFFKPLELLKGNAFRKSWSINPKKILVTFQFIISIFLIIQSIIIYQQIKYMISMDLGFNKENLLFTTLGASRDVDFDQFRSRILKYPEIIDASMSESIPFHGNNGWPMTWEGNPSGEKIDIRFNAASVDFINTFGLKIVLGRNFSRNYGAEKDKTCVINETAWKIFGWKNPLGKLIDNHYQVIGVVRDFHPYSVHNRIAPYLIVLKNRSMLGYNKYSFRIVNGKIAEARKILTEEFERYFPEDPFEFHIFSEDFKRDGTFEVWRSINNTVLFFTVLIIILAVIGIFGLVSFTTQRRTKEIGIKKVHGSPILKIYLGLIKEFLLLLLISAFIASPAALYMYQFIPGDYKYGIYPWEFLFAIGIVLLITFVTTSYHTIKVAMTNPIEALRDE